MFKTVLIGLAGLIVGLIAGYLFILNPGLIDLSSDGGFNFESPLSPPHNQVIGFLPYWLLGKARLDYSPYVTQLAYFSLTPDVDGTIKKLNSPVEAEPGWYALSSGKANSFFKMALTKHLSLSLVIFSGDSDTIAQLVSDPERNADHLMGDVLPLMKKYHFSDLNLDIEDTTDATSGASFAFTQFVAQVKHRLNTSHAGTLTVDITGDDLIRSNLIDPVQIGKIADFVLVMTYDFHFPGSSVTGPVAPLGGAGTVSEYDVSTAIQKALAIIPSEKVIMGVPLYGYEWETLGDDPRSGVIPGTGITASSERVEELLSHCSSCSAKLDSPAQEDYIVYKDQDTLTYHQLFYPNAQATEVKVNFARQEKLGGIALWALGYEDSTILNPLKNYKD
ncbi:MAG TPA: glycosyl hydrolase family 18 protein [Patescibacteria group bacterium]|nr:glycosyl hydrolase family 18 protein [Patescibacteria group bacterium]